MRHARVGHHGVTSVRQIAANRRNARLSTGPKTPAGKARAARNARRHGLNLSARRDPQHARAIAAVARSIAGADASVERRERAERLAAAHVELMRVRQARQDLYSAPLTVDEVARRLARLDYYERRALSRRKFAIMRRMAVSRHHAFWRKRTQFPRRTRPPKSKRGTQRRRGAGPQH